MLSIDACRARQRRFSDSLSDYGVDAALITRPRDIYRLTGLPVENKNFDFPNALFLAPDHPAWLVTWNADGEASVDRREIYQPGLFATINPDNHRQVARMVEGLAGADSKGLARIGYQGEGGVKSIVDAFLRASGADEAQPIDEALERQRLRKDPDEVESIRAAQRANGAAYARAAEIIAPGISELEVLAECHKAANAATGKQHYFSGDFRCGEPGGPARDRAIRAGEIYIIDAWADVDGYWSDLCRAWIVGGEPTELQRSVYDHLAAIVAEVPERVEPEGSCRSFWGWLDARVREHPRLADVGLIHHGGHGIGLCGHEAPDISRDRDGTFEIGCTFTVEPGAYLPELRGGIRLENNFLLTDTGVENLSPFPFDFVPRTG